MSLAVGLFLFAFGIVLLLESELGLSPWDVLNQGISEHTSLSFGTANIVVALCVLVLAWALGARIGPGTVANAVLIGLMVDGLLAIDAIDSPLRFAARARIAMMIGGVLVIGIGSGLYIGAGMGAGPRDSLMLVAARRAHVRIGVSRVAIEVPSPSSGSRSAARSGSARSSSRSGSARPSSSRSGCSSGARSRTRRPTCRTRRDRG